MPRRAKAPVAGPALGNVVGEWFGYRVYPTVSASQEGLQDQQNGRCPFISSVTNEVTACVKSAAASGVCTISSTSNGVRQDWLVCPYRALDSGLLEDAARRLFEVPSNVPLLVVPASTLNQETVRSAVSTAVEAGGRVVAYLRSKLGGEISISPTDRSPELAFDITMVELLAKGSGFTVEKYGILEVQTMDFHGSYRYAVNNLKDSLRLHTTDFHRVLEENNGRWLSDHIEGPNIANVFKRTFYQMVLKFQIGSHESSAGCVFAIPLSVWDSWQRHLGKPELQTRSDGTKALLRPGASLSASRVPGWIYVFDMEADSSSSPNPIRIVSVIATDSESVSYYAVKVVPEAAVAQGGAAGFLLTTIRRRLAKFWPVFLA